jgi:hypothetical protein
VSGSTGASDALPRSLAHPDTAAGSQPGSGLLRVLPDLRGPNLSARRVTEWAEWAASVATPQWLLTIRLESVVEGLDAAEDAARARIPARS